MDLKLLKRELHSGGIDEHIEDGVPASWCVEAQVDITYKGCACLTGIDWDCGCKCLEVLGCFHGLA